MTAPRPPEAHSEQARRIAGYEILSKLGQGGMGAVYKARQLSLDRMVALKVLPKQLTSSQDFIQRFSREARVTGQLNHPNIIKVFDVGRSNTGICYYSMEYVEGENLRSVLDREKRLGVDTVLRILEEMASALAHAHRHGIIHRDIKPDNILIDREGASKLADLGLAKVAEDAASSAAAGGGAYASIAGQVVGTPYYMSPEQAEGAAVDTRSDLYSLGATAFHLLAGTPPFTADTPMGVITKHLTEPVPSIRSRIPGVPLPVDALLRRLMAKDPSARFQTPGEFLAEVSRIRREIASPSAPAHSGAPASSRTPLLVGGGALLAVLVILALAMRGKRTKGVVVPTPGVVAPVPPPDPEREALAAKVEAEKQTGPALLQALRDVAGRYPGTQAAKNAELRIHDILRADCRQLKDRVAALQAAGSFREALAVLDGFQPLAEDRADLDRLRGEIQALLDRPPRPDPTPPAPSVEDPSAGGKARSAELSARLEGVREAARAHDWKKVLDLAGGLLTELGLEPEELNSLARLRKRSEINLRLARRWRFDDGDEGWVRGPSLSLPDGRPQDATGTLSFEGKALRFGASGSNPRCCGEVMGPLFSLQAGARLSLKWSLEGRGRAPRISFAYACLRDDKGKRLSLARKVDGPVPDLLRCYRFRKFRDEGKGVTLNFRADPLELRPDLAPGREIQARLCFGFCTNEPQDFSASMVLDDIEVFYGEDAT